MKIAIYGKSFDKSFGKSIEELFMMLNNYQSKILLYEPLFNFLQREFGRTPDKAKLFNYYDEIDRDVDYMLSIGGDGTFLEAVSMVRQSGIPIVGINTGRLGFLASISEKEIKNAMHAILNKEYTIAERTLIKLETGQENDLFLEFNYALNEITIQKKGSTMITIHAFMNGDFLNSYWADGLIISTPTGSTAYSLSVGGPIVVPESKNIIISPIAPHNLTMRPIVVPDTSKLEFKIGTRSNEFLVSLDYRSKFYSSGTCLNIKKANFKIKILKLNGTDFFQTLRGKLMWGADNRN